MIYEDEIHKLCCDNDSGSGEWKKSLLIFIPLRLGVETIPTFYHRIITTLFQYPQSLGMAGGKPRSSLYFFAVQGILLFVKK